MMRGVVYWGRPGQKGKLEHQNTKLQFIHAGTQGTTAALPDKSESLGRKKGGGIICLN